MRLGDGASCDVDMLVLVCWGGVELAIVDSIQLGWGRVG